MSAESVVRALVDRVWNGGHLDDLEHLFAAGFDHAGRLDDVAGLRAWHEGEAATWAECRYDIVDLVSDGERVALRWRASARQVGQWGPVPPTGRVVTWDGAHFFTVRDGLIIAMWAMGDMFAKAIQLGVTMTPPA